MITKVYSVYDNKSMSYKSPFYASARGEAVRTFTVGVNTPNSQLNMFPDDFELWEVAEFDDVTCKFENITPLMLGRAREYLKGTQNDILHTEESTKE